MAVFAFKTKKRRKSGARQERVKNISIVFSTMIMCAYPQIPPTILTPGIILADRLSTNLTPP